MQQTEEYSDDEEEDDEAFIERSPSIIDKSLELPYKESYLTMKEGTTQCLFTDHNFLYAHSIARFYLYLRQYIEIARPYLSLLVKALKSCLMYGIC